MKNQAVHERSHTCTHLLMVFNPHTQGVDEDGNHNSLIKVFAFHYAFQSVPEIVPVLSQAITLLQDFMMGCTAGFELCSMGELVNHVPFWSGVVWITELNIHGLQGPCTIRAAQELKKQWTGHHTSHLQQNTTVAYMGKNTVSQQLVNAIRKRKRSIAFALRSYDAYLPSSSTDLFF